MKYRTFAGLDWKPSALGFGAMRLPYLDNDVSKIDEALAVKMIRYAIDHGVNYVDTAYPYHSGNSEILVGKALGNGYRERVKLATKMPTWLVNSQEDMDKYLDEQLEKLQTDFIDFYLLHGLRRARWPSLKELNVFEWAEKAIERNKIGYLGFSFHDDFDLFKEIVDSYDGWTFCQIQYNYLDVEYQAGTKGLKYAASKGLAVVVMEPVAGGRLAVPPPNEIKTILEESHVKRTPADWALQWVWNQPEVSLALSGMSNMQQVVENIESAERSGVGTLSTAELETIERVRNAYQELGYIGCTNCRYCVPCPEGVAIPEIIGFMNQFYKSGRDEGVKTEYLEEIRPESRAKLCVSCGNCEEQCPQQLPIRSLIRTAGRIFETEMR